MASSGELDQMIKSGELIESTSEMTPEYLRELKHTLIVSGDTELISAPAYYLAAKRAPSINAFMTGSRSFRTSSPTLTSPNTSSKRLAENRKRSSSGATPRTFRN